jgi:GT2 family glycosyltransferase
MSISLCVGMVSYNNNEQQIAAALRSIATSLDMAVSHFNIDSTILLGQNGSESPTDLSKHLIETHKIVQYPTSGNIGFGAAMNELMRSAFQDFGADYFLTLNPDTYSHPDAVSNLLRIASINSSAVVEAKQFPDEHPKNYDPISGETDWASGACMLIPKIVYEATDGFDANFFMYMEDVDFSWRARSTGAKILHCPTALIGHQTADRPCSPAVSRAMFESGLYLGCKWRSDTFQTWCTDELTKRCNLDSLKVELILLAAQKRCELLQDKWQAKDLSIANFDQYFSFAQPRW